MLVLKDGAKFGFSAFGSCGSQMRKNQLTRSLSTPTTLSGKGAPVGETGGVPHATSEMPKNNNT